MRRPGKNPGAGIPRQATNQALSKLVGMVPYAQQTILCREAEPLRL
jgi:hypothetical protein